MLPHWRRSRDGKYLVRTFQLAAEGAPLAFASVLLALAKEEGHHLAVTLCADTVVCKLTTPAAGGVTARDLDMARRISVLG
jgi:pterin-4a-carbinolamine dehydratase